MATSDSKRKAKLKTVTIPLIGEYKIRGLDGTETLINNKDQRFLNCIFETVDSPVTGDKTIYVSKRPGWQQDLIVVAGESSTGLLVPQTINFTFSAFGSVNSTIYRGGTSVGTITGLADHFKEVVLSGVTYIMIRSKDGTGWFFAEDAADTTAYTGDTHTNTTIDNIVPSTTGMYKGQVIAGTNIVAGTRILSVDSSSQITVDTATTGTSVGVAITKTPIAKITDTDFDTTGTFISGFEEMNGYLYYATDDGNLHNSDLNSATSWPALGLIATALAPDEPRAVSRYRDRVIVFGSASKEAFNDVGNATGSPLQRWAQDFENIGALHQRSVVKFENDIYFVSSPALGNVSVYRYDGVRTEKISTPRIDRIIGTVSTASSTIYASSFKLGGYSYVGFALSTASEVDNLLLLESGDKLLLESGDDIILEGSPASTSSFSRFLLYNIELKNWSEWDSTKASYIQGSVFSSGNFLQAASRFETDGKTYKISEDSPVYADDGTTYTMEIRTSPVDFNNRNRKFIHRIRLIADKEASGSATIEWSDDDYGTFSTARTFDLTKTNPQITGCGSHVGARVYKIKHTSNNPFRAQALEITYSEGRF